VGEGSWKREREVGNVRRGVGSGRVELEVREGS